MKIKVIKDSENKLSRFAITVKNTGFFYDTIPGISHLLEHLLCNSSKGLVFNDLKDVIDANAYTSDGFTYFVVNTSNKIERSNKLFNFKDIFNHIFTHEFNDEEITREKEIIRNELSGHTKRYEYFYAMYTEAFYKDIKFYNSKEQSNVLDSITKEDLEKFYKDRYTMENIEVILTGNWNDEEIKYIKDFVDKQDYIPSEGNNDTRLCAPISYIAGDIRHLREKDSPYTDYEYVIAFEYNDEMNKKYIAYNTLLNYIIKNSSNSLFNDIRDLGSYDVWVDTPIIHLGGRHTDPLRIFVGFFNEDKAIVDKMRDKAIEYFTNFESKLTKEEFEYMKRNTYLNYHHSPKDGFTVNEVEAFIDDFNNHDEFCEDINKVTYNELIEYIKGFRHITNFLMIPSNVN